MTKEIDDFIVFGISGLRTDKGQTFIKHMISIVIMLIGTFILGFRSARSSLGHSVEKSNHSNKNQKVLLQSSTKFSYPTFHTKKKSFEQQA